MTTVAATGVNRRHARLGLSLHRALLRDVRPVRRGRCVRGRDARAANVGACERDARDVDDGGRRARGAGDARRQSRRRKCDRRRGAHR